MRITKRQLKRLIRETISGEGGQSAGAASSLSTPEAWASKNGLGVEIDNDGQKVIYLDNAQADALNFPPGVNWDAEQNYDGETWTVYTGEYEDENI